MARIRGSYPGGPRRRDGGARPPVRLESAEALQGRLGRAVRRRGIRRRATRAWLALAAALALAGGAGLYLGMRATRTSEQLTAERDEQLRSRELDLTRETNRILLELWKMEDLEGRAGGLR